MAHLNRKLVEIKPSLRAKFWWSLCLGIKWSTYSKSCGYNQVVFAKSISALALMSAQNISTVRDYNI